MYQKYFYFALFSYILLYFLTLVKYKTTQFYPRYNFSSKELFDGPLLMKREYVKGLGKVVITNDLSSLFPTKSSIPDSISVNERLLNDIGNVAVELSEKNGSFIYFMFINDAFSRLTLNFLCNTQDFENVHERLLLITVSSYTCQNIRKIQKKVHCTSLNMDTFDSPAVWGTEKYRQILNIRFSLMRKLIEKAVTFVLIEPDSVWLKEPLQLFTRNQTEDLMVPIKGKITKSNDSLSFDPMLVNPTSDSLQAFVKMEQLLLKNSSLYDQDLLNQFCESKKLKCATFPWNDVADGIWFKKSEEERKLYSPYIINNNFYIGIKEKETRQALNGFWFSTTAGVCLSQKVRLSLKKYKP